jgi:hypothetical protein
MTQMKLISEFPERPSAEGRDMIAEKLKELEGRVKAAVALVAKVKGEKASLEQRVGELQTVIKKQAEEMKAIEVGRKKEQEHLSRILEEREAVRVRVDRLLEEIGRIEASADKGS